MKPKNLLGALATMLVLSLSAQERPKMFYATMDTQDALKLKRNHPKDVKIIKSLKEYSAVMLNEHSAKELHHTGLRHGPGYFYENSKEDAINTIEQVYAIKQTKQNSLSKNVAVFQITQDQLVYQSLGLVNNSNIETQIRELENYGTRYHTKSSAARASRDLKTKWQNIAGNRSDVSVRLVNHSNTSMPSVIMTITGSEKPDEYVVIGGHLDSTSREGQNNAPGADDNASGIATITEAARVLFSMNFKPKRTVEFMAFAAEEVGLVGSKEIARDYKRRNVNIVSYMQLDMTNYKGSTRDIFITTDTYNSTSLNNFLKKLMDHYNASGAHKITYSNSACNYGCSDHHSFAQQGYETAFPIEARFSESNPHIHTSRDTSSRFPTANATHAAKFAKLALEYLIEISNGVSGGGNPSNYCSSNGQSTSDEYISRVALGAINKTSTAAAGGYSDFTAESTNLSKGSSNTITITPTWSGTTYSEGYSVWIDYNQDGDFADAGEQVWSKTASKTSPVSGSFTVPSSAKDGKTRMRVSMKYNAIPTSCESFQYGEVEDYTVVIGGSGGGDTQAPSAPSGLTASNIAQTSLTLSWNAATDNVGVTGYDVYKGNTVSTSVSGTTASITGLTASTTYQFSVKAKDAAGNISASSTAVSATTSGGSSDPCAGVPPYSSSQTYQPGDRVTYQGYLYERTNSGWTLIGPCGASARSFAPVALVDNNSLFEFYPNPVAGENITVTVNNNLWKTSSSMLIIDVKGNILQEVKLITKATEINTSKFSSGIYFLTLFDGVKSYTKQMIVK
ncbi:M20/M25/M40 family metallo-hydrolase [Aquimarina sediminis]|uniref:M20/M25/M40 family metallo-hydrolase n=1 Tax=Aquimarina sediminis TaxID=2070536 RepID=UPI000CA0177E|nr:M20/M25/M40 family metallo-hydrolase [Aquimarina sediminis]